MKKIVTSILLLCWGIVLIAEKADTLTMAIRQYTSAERMLGLPAQYVVLRCEITINPGKGSLYRVFYVKGGQSNCPNVNANNFEKLWSEQLTLFASASGTIVAVAEIIVQKGDKQMKWMPKIFVVP